MIRSDFSACDAARDDSLDQFAALGHTFPMIELRERGNR